MAADISPRLAMARRFGYGPANWRDAAPEALVRALAGPDEMAARFPVPPQREVLAHAAELVAARRDTADAGRAQALARGIRDMRRQALGAAFARIAATRTPLRERLCWFWTGHFTNAPRAGWQRGLQGAFVDEAIRPNLAGRFADLLRAAELHPAMVLYLDQQASIGPKSPRGRESGKGLNENLAREILELHTLGTGGGYSQRDVGEFAKLLTGITFVHGKGTVFRGGRAEPGAETVLGTSYGTDAGKERIGPVLRALDDLAVHPATAAHLARKLAVHFVADAPPDDLVAALTGRYLATGGELGAVYEVLLSHPAATAGAFVKIRQPLDYLGAAVVALGIAPGALAAPGGNLLNRWFERPLRQMGQPFLDAPAPNGWPEAAGQWLTPQGLAQRVDWAMSAPSRIAPGLPAPEDFARRALGAPDRATLEAVSRAETREEAVGLVLAAPAFHRR